MRRSLVALLTLGLLLGCQDHDLPTDSDRPGVSSAISDGSGNFEQGNPHFFWLAPMVEQPDESLFGTFDPDGRPVVRIVCWEDSDPGATCDPASPLATFTVGGGLLVETDHYKAEFDVEGLRTTTDSEEDFTTYRIEVLTPDFGDLGGSSVMGFADFQLGENGKEAKNLDSGGTIGLKDGRTLPIKFRLDQGALGAELVESGGLADEFCQINCSVTIIDQDQDTEASLFDEDGEELTAMLIPAGAVWTTETSVLVIDERVDDGDTEDGEDCIANPLLKTEACFRYELSPDNPDGDDFTEDIRFGVCPEGQAVSGGSILPTWRILKADLVDDEVDITRPPEVDVSDFLACDVSTTVTLWDGPGGRLAGSALQWLVPPLQASDAWGGQLRDLSDLFWGEDIEMDRLSFPSIATEGTTLPMSVELLAIHNDSAPVAGREVTFERTGGSSLSPASGFPFVSSIADSIVTVETDASGQATVNWQIVEGTNRLEVTSSDARPAAGEPDPLAFDVTGTAAELAYVTNLGSDSVSVIDVGANSVLAEIGGVGVQPIAVAVTPDGSTAYIANFGSGDVSVIDVGSFSVTGTIGVGTDPVSVAVTPDGSTVYVANQGSGDVSVIDVASNSVSTTIPVPGGPTDLAVVPSGDSLHVSKQFRDSVAVIDVASNSVLNSLPAGDGPTGFAVTPGGDSLYVANNPTSSMTVIPIRSPGDSAVLAVGSAPRDVAFTPDGTTAYVANVGSGDVSVIDVTSLSVTSTITTGAGANRVAVKPDGSVAYVTNRNADNVSVIDVASNSVIETIPVGDAPVGVAFVPTPAVIP